MKNVLTTILKAKYRSWKDCEADLVRSDGSPKGGFWLVNTMNLSKHSGIGALCYLIYDGQIRGYMDCVDVAPTENYRDKHRIGKRRNTQSLILANWHPVAAMPYTGFQGWRYTDLRP